MSHAYQVIIHRSKSLVCKINNTLTHFLESLTCIKYITVTILDKNIYGVFSTLKNVEFLHTLRHLTHGLWITSVK